MRLPALIVSAFALAFAGGVAAAEFSSLEERMSDQDFRGAGLDRLSAEELERLNAWLRANIGQIGAAQVAEERVGFKDGGGLLGDNSDSGPVTSRIKGEFSGWNRGTMIELENGQTWQVTESDSFGIPKTMNPGVTIKPALLGSWLLKLEGFNHTVRVTRIR
jgi:hypothetical protein